MLVNVEITATPAQRLLIAYAPNVTLR